MAGNLNARIHPFANRRRLSSCTTASANPILRSTFAEECSTTTTTAATGSSLCSPTIKCLSPHAPSPTSAACAAVSASHHSGGACSSPPHHTGPEGSAVQHPLLTRLTPTQDVAGHQFMRCIHLLNLAVRSQLEPGSNAAGHVAYGGARLHGQDRLISTKVTKLRHMTNIARLVDVAPVVITVYQNACTIEDPNGEAAHARLLAQYEPSDVVGGGGVTSAVPRAYRPKTTPAAREGDCDASSSCVQSCLFVFSNIDDVQQIVRDVCGTYMPRVLEYVYPEGVVLEGHWRGDEAMPTVTALGYASIPWCPVTGGHTHRPVVGQDADKDRALRLGGDVADGGHRLGGVPNKRPHDRTLLVDNHHHHHHASDHERQDDALASSGGGATRAPPSVTPKTHDDAHVTLLTPIGRLVFCRRQRLDETWGDVREWLMREVRSIAARSPTHAPPPSPLSAASIVFHVGGVGCTSVPLPAWESCIGPRGIVVRCTWQNPAAIDSLAAMRRQTREGRKQSSVCK